MRGFAENFIFSSNVLHQASLVKQCPSALVSPEYKLSFVGFHSVPCGMVAAIRSDGPVTMDNSDSATVNGSFAQSTRSSFGPISSTVINNSVTKLAPSVS